MHWHSLFNFLVLDFLIYLQNLVEESIWPMLAKESLKALAGLGLLSLGGKYLLRRVFEVQNFMFDKKTLLKISFVAKTNPNLSN